MIPGYFGDAGGPLTMGVGQPANSAALDWWAKNERSIGRKVEITNLPVLAADPPPLTEADVRKIIQEELAKALPAVIDAALRKTLPRQFFE